MNDTQNIFAIENGWLLACGKRVRLAAVNYYAKVGATVALSGGGDNYQLDFERELQNRGASDDLYNRAHAVAVDLMVALDRHFWANIVESDHARSTLIRELLALGVSKERIAKMASVNLSTVLAIAKAEGLASSGS